MLENNCNGIFTDTESQMEFFMNSHPIFLSEDDIGKRKTINKYFHNSCMLVKIGEKYIIGRLNWTDAVGYSMDINGEEMRFSYSETEMIFKHNPVKPH
jgi:hypothetical protein